MVEPGDRSGNESAVSVFEGDAQSVAFSCSFDHFRAHKGELFAVDFGKGESGKEVGATLGEYVAAMREILGEYGVESIDLYENGFPKPLVSTGDEYTKDGLHPNDNGYVFLANIVCDYVREKMAR